LFYRWKTDEADDAAHCSGDRRFLACVHFVDSSQAQIVEGPWCAIRNFGSDISEDCQFRTFEECPGDVIAGSAASAIKIQGGKANRRNRGRAGKVKSGVGNRPLAVVAFRLPFWL
jgi:hypothetical protein